MKITIEQVKADIQSGKSKMIYFSAHNLWWTHLDSDLQEAMKTGKLAMDERNKRFMESPNVPEAEKKRLQSLIDSISKAEHQIPCDPTGSVLYQTDNPMKWVTSAEEKPDHFGTHKLDAFMKSHHQNCEHHIYKEWAKYNLVLEAEK